MLEDLIPDGSGARAVPRVEELAQGADRPRGFGRLRLRIGGDRVLEAAGDGRGDVRGADLRGRARRTDPRLLEPFDEHFADALALSRNEAFPRANEVRMRRNGLA